MEEEQEVLLSIFDKSNDFEITSLNKTFILHFDFPPDYPSSIAKISLKCPRIDTLNTVQQIDFEKRLIAEIENVIANSTEVVGGEVQVFTIHEIVKELLESDEFMSKFLDVDRVGLNASANDLAVTDEDLTAAIEELKILDLHEGCPEIFSSEEALIEKKSVFIAHVAKVESMKEVKKVQKSLLADKKVQKATHNISAYRIVTSDGITMQDFNDDGETHAGQRLLHLLQLSNCSNVVVYVSRYYGGIQLGPLRFKCIQNCARDLLVKKGFIS